MNRKIFDLLSKYNNNCVINVLNYDIKKEYKENKFEITLSNISIDLKSNYRFEMEDKSLKFSDDYQNTKSLIKLRNLDPENTNTTIEDENTKPFITLEDLELSKYEPKGFDFSNEVQYEFKGFDFSNMSNDILHGKYEFTYKASNTYKDLELTSNNLYIKIDQNTIFFFNNKEDKIPCALCIFDNLLYFYIYVNNQFVKCITTININPKNIQKLITLYNIKQDDILKTTQSSFKEIITKLQNFSIEFNVNNITFIEYQQQYFFYLVEIIIKTNVNLYDPSHEVEDNTSLLKETDMVNIDSNIIEFFTIYSMLVCVNNTYSDVFDMTKVVLEKQSQSN